MFEKTVVRVLRATANTSVLVLTLSVSSMAWGDTMTLTTIGTGSVTIPAGYE